MHHTKECEGLFLIVGIRGFVRGVLSESDAGVAYLLRLDFLTYPQCPLLTRGWAHDMTSIVGKRIR